MDKIKICEAMYALPGRLWCAAVPRTACRAACGRRGDTGSESRLRSLDDQQPPLVGGVHRRFAGPGGDDHARGALFSAEGAPYRAGRSCLRYDELYFERSQSRDVVALVAEGNVERLLAMPHARVPAVSVAMYRTPDNRFAAMQAFEYADLEYRPLTRLQISPLKEEACEA